MKKEKLIITNKYTFNFDNDKVFQGLCYAKDNIFITAYDKNHNNSMIYILNNKFKFIRQVELYNNSHVGGICFDIKNDIFWITDKQGTISGYTYESIINCNNICNPKYKKIKVSNNDLENHLGIQSVAYITYFKNKIYLGNFKTKGTSNIKSYNINEDGTINLESEKKYKFINKVQSITFKEINNKIYMFTSCSYGRYNKSNLKIYEFKENIYDYSNKKYIDYVLPNMLEQICIKDNKLYTLYEINSYRKDKAIFKFSDLIIYDIKKLAGGD